MNEVLVKHTGQSYETVEHDTDRDNIMGAEDAKAYGLIDEIFEPRKVRALGAFTGAMPSLPAGKQATNGSK